MTDNEWGVMIYLNKIADWIEIHLSFPFSQNIYSSLHQLYKKNNFCKPVYMLTVVWNPICCYASSLHIMATSNPLQIIWQETYFN